MTAQPTASTAPAGKAGTTTTALDGRGSASRAWRRIGEVTREMNYAASRLAAPDVTGR